MGLPNATAQQLPNTSTSKGVVINFYSPISTGDNLGPQSSAATDSQANPATDSLAAGPQSSVYGSAPGSGQSVASNYFNPTLAANPNQAIQNLYTQYNVAQQKKLEALSKFQEAERAKYNFTAAAALFEAQNKMNQRQALPTSYPGAYAQTAYAGGAPNAYPSVDPFGQAPMMQQPAPYGGNMAAQAMMARTLPSPYQQFQAPQSQPAPQPWQNGAYTAQPSAAAYNPYGYGAPMPVPNNNPPTYPIGPAQATADAPPSPSPAPDSNSSPDKASSSAAPVAAASTDASQPGDAGASLAGAKPEVLNQMILSDDELAKMQAGSPQDDLNLIQQGDLQARENAIGEVAIQSNKTSFPDETINRLETLAQLNPKTVKDPVAKDNLEYFTKTNAWTLGLLGGNPNLNPQTRMGIIQNLVKVASDPQETEGIQKANVQAIQAMNMPDAPEIKAALEKITKAHSKKLLNPTTWFRPGLAQSVKDTITAAQNGVPIAPTPAASPDDSAKSGDNSQATDFNNYLPGGADASQQPQAAYSGVQRKRYA